MSTIFGILAAHAEIAWDHTAGKSICAGCNESFGPLTAGMGQQDKWLLSHQAAVLAAAGIGDVRECKAQALEEAANGLGIDSDVSGATIRSWLRARAFVIREGNA